MTVCNMSIEAGARAGMVAPDETTFAYLAFRPRAPEGRRVGTRASKRGATLPSDPGAAVRRDGVIDAAALGPQVTWGTSPGMTAEITERVPDPADAPTDADRQSYQRALEYMELRPGTPLEGLKVDRVFLGSCTNARIEDLREAAKVARGRQRRERRACDGRPRLAAGEGRGGARRPRSDLHRSRIRMAESGLLDVSRHERGRARSGRALRVDVESELRGTAGEGRADAPDESGDGGGRGDRRTSGGRAGYMRGE